MVTTNWAVTGWPWVAVAWGGIKVELRMGKTSTTWAVLVLARVLRVLV